MRPLLTALLLLQLCASSVQAEEVPRCGEDGRDEVEAVLARHITSSESLMVSRGISSERLRPRDIVDFGRALMRDLMPETALLVYGLNDAGDLCMVLLRHDGQISLAVAPAALPRLEAALKQFTAVSGIARAAAKRAPAARGATPIEEAADMNGTSEDHLQTLSELLFPPSIVAGLDGVRHLDLAPQGPIGAVPFSALPLGGSPALASRMSYTILPNLMEAAPGYLELTDGTIARRGQNTGVASGPALVVGNPDGTGDQDWDFPALPGAEAEAIAIAGRKGVKPLLGTEATLQNVRARLSGSPQLIYIAAHGIADPDDPLSGSFIKLEGGRLTAREIQEMRLPAVPVFLSACQTGLGFAHQGGIIGLARAFDIAGAGPVLVSLWSIDDEATREIMLSTTGHLERSALPEALRVAVEEYRINHPAQVEKWGAFSVFGK